MFWFDVTWKHPILGIDKISMGHLKWVTCWSVGFLCRYEKSQFERCCVSADGLWRVPFIQVVFRSWLMASGLETPLSSQQLHPSGSDWVYRLFPSLVLQLQLPEESERLNVPPGENICLSGPLQGEQRLLEGALREGTASASVWALQTRACMKTPSPSYPLTFSSRRLCSGRCSNANISSSLRAPPGPRRLFNDCMFECAKSGWTAFRVGDSVHALACACLCLLELSTAVNASLAINISPSSWGQAKNRLLPHSST